MELSNPSQINWKEGKRGATPTGWDLSNTQTKEAKKNFDSRKKTVAKPDAGNPYLNKQRLFRKTKMRRTC